MVDDVCLGTFIWAAVVVGAEVEVRFPIFEFLPGQCQGMTAAGTEKTGDGARLSNTSDEGSPFFEQFQRKTGLFLWKPEPVEDFRKDLKKSEKRC